MQLSLEVLHKVSKSEERLDDSSCFTAKVSGCNGISKKSFYFSANCPAFVKDEGGFLSIGTKSRCTYKRAGFTYVKDKGLSIFEEQMTHR